MLSHHLLALDYACCVLIVIAAIYIIFLDDITVEGKSMEPTLVSGCRVLFIKSKYIPKCSYKKGDIIIFSLTNPLRVHDEVGHEPKVVELLIKRIQIVNSDGSRFTVVGDNHDVSFDMTIHLDKIVGRAVFV